MIAADLNRMCSSAGSGIETMAYPDFDLEDRLLNYSAQIIDLADCLPNTRSGAHIAGQILRAGTSPLPNHGEAQAAESRNDFIHKMRICLKELREARRWLRLIERSPRLKKIVEVSALITETEELIKIFFTSIRTAAEKRTRVNLATKGADGSFAKSARLKRAAERGFSSNLNVES